jgi:mono/diheme cytochrome c family protein
MGSRCWAKSLDNMRSLNLLLLTLLIFTGCNYTRMKSEPNENEPLPEELAQKLSFALVFEEVFAPKCVGCHQAGNKVNLQEYSSTIAKLKDIERTVFETKTMPKQGSLSARQESILRAWITAGAPEFSKDPPPPPEKIEAKFSSIDKLIFQTRCVVCHNPEGSTKHILLTLDFLLNSPRELVLPENPDDSGLIIAIERDDIKRMPPAKEGYARLSDEEILAIRQWIVNGAKD